MFLLVGMEKGRCRKCRRPFVPKTLTHRFCSTRCRCDYNARRSRARRARLPHKVRCLRCRQFFLVRSSAKVPRQKFCEHTCAAAYNMQLSRHRKFLVRVGYDEINGIWYTPEGVETTFKAAQKTAGLTKRAPRHAITSDGRTVWVNGVAGLLGRFGNRGIDIHRPLLEQEDRGECLHCTHEPTERPDWDTFVIKMREHFGIYVAGSYMPTRFRKKRKNPVQ